MSQLAVYEHAKEALAAAVRFDEVTQLHSAAEKAEAYARIAKDRKLQADAAEIVARAERKLGIMLRAAKDEGLLSKGGRPANSNLTEPETGTDAEPVFDNTPFTLAEIGVDKKLSSRAQKAAALDDESFEGAVQVTREKIFEADAPVVRAPRAKPVKVDKPEPVKPLEPRKWHQFAFSVLALCMASDRVSSEAILKLGEFTGVLDRDGDTVDFTPAAIEAMGSLATAALKALDGDETAPGGLPGFEGEDDDDEDHGGRARGLAGSSDPEEGRAEGREDGGGPDGGAEHHAGLLHSLGTADHRDRGTTHTDVAPGCDAEPAAVASAAGLLSRDEQDAIIRDGYAVNRPLAELEAATGLAANVIKGRARRMGLSSRDRQREIARSQMQAINARKAGEP